MNSLYPGILGFTHVLHDLEVVFLDITLGGEFLPHIFTVSPLIQASTYILAFTTEIVQKSHSLQPGLKDQNKFF